MESEKTPKKSIRGIARRVLKEYADRGVFQGFYEKKHGAGRSEFQFQWFHEKPMVILCTDKDQSLMLKDWLPNISSRSKIYSELKTFLAERYSLDLPEHRRVDRKSAEVKCTNEKGKVSIILKAKKSQYEYGVKKLLDLINEVYFFLKVAHSDYIWANFEEPLTW